LETQYSTINTDFGQTTDKLGQIKIDYVPSGIECIRSVQDHIGCFIIQTSNQDPAIPRGMSFEDISDAQEQTAEVW
jgi:hypothetical protein